MRFPSRFRVFLIFLLAVLRHVSAEVTMPAIFGDHMVLQEEAKLPIWGRATPGERVTVTLAGQNGSAVATADGTWRVDLPAVPQNEKGETLTVAGSNTLTFQDVLIGDVWIASGQSNMEFGIHADSRAGEALAHASDPQLRLFYVPKVSTFEPKTDIGSRTSPLSGKWLVCTPESLGGAYGWNGFSAVAYYFGQEIRKRTDHPVGLIETSWGGTPAQAWTSSSGLEKAPELAHYVNDCRSFDEHYKQAQEALPQLMTDYQVSLKQWTDEVETPFVHAVESWNADAEKAKAEGKPIPPVPVPTSPQPVPPSLPDAGPNFPTDLYNGMVAPLIPYAIKGVIWYQGESNGINTPLGQEYAVLFPRMIQDWREKWGQGDFPFLYVQLANFQTAPDWNFPLVREAQLKTLSLPLTGMASAIDIGNPGDIHPTDKLDVGLRLALAARHVAYGEDIVCAGPVYDSMTVEGEKIRLTFKNGGGDLVMGTPPWTPNGQPVEQAKELTGFEIAGADGNFIPAEASFEGGAIVVSSDKIPSPTAVRYDWANSPSPLGNLYNKEGLPASPFRTDESQK